MEISIGLRRYCAAVMELVDGNVINDDENADNKRIELSRIDTTCTYVINKTQIRVNVTGPNINQDYSIERLGDNYACSFRVTANSRSPRKMQRIVNERNAATKFREWITNELPII